MRLYMLIKWISNNLHVISIYLIISNALFSNISAAENPYWFSYDNVTGKHIHRTKSELDSVLKKHEQWLKKFPYIYDERGKEIFSVPIDSMPIVNLENAKLTNVDLQEALLYKMDLRGVDLDSSNLFHSNLSEADLRGAELNYANLGLANLHGANLSNTNLSFSVLYDASIFKASLVGANLFNADLRIARFNYSDLKYVKFEPAALPSIEDIAYATDLEYLRYCNSPKSLVLLKNLFREAGFRDAARKVNTALQRESIRHNTSKFGSIETVIFDYTCEFGANSTRPLWLIILVWIPCTFIYLLALHLHQGTSGLYLLYSGKNFNTGDDHIRERKLYCSPSLKLKGYRSIIRLIRLEWRAFKTASFFSFMRVFRALDLVSEAIGLRKINIGRWIRMIQPRPFDIKARGLPWVVSGIQSGLSLCLIALWLLSQFGNFFDY